MSDSMVESWTLLGDDVAPVARYLAYLAAVERSPIMSRPTPTT
jgi:hypothetical protein